MKTIVFVDDERLITRKLKQVFDDDMHNYVCFNKGQDVLDYMDENTVDLLCTDIMMPDMDGYELLFKVKEKYPKTIRIALSSMNNAQIKRLNTESLAQYYVIKPWHDVELKQNIFKILSMQLALYSDEVVEMIHEMGSLPTIPKIYDQLTEMVKRDAPIEDISAIIENDQSTTASILKIANSAFYGRRTGDIAQAIMNIGLENLKNIVLSHAVFTAVEDDLERLERMWSLTTFTNKLMSAIYLDCLHKPIPRLFGSTGLLHDIGRLLFYSFHIDYEKILKEAQDESRLMSDIEKEIYGVCHQDLGGFLLNSWDLPFAYVETAMFHHRPLDFRVINRELVCVTHLAHYFADHSDDLGTSQLDPKVFRVLKITQDEVERLVQRIKENT